ncbi:hypothetical protein [Yersinia vastinensis]|uniref:hypothetical protein n=1 Tax=Yersinia vastinensis TaxID=2890318 RepID=UPI0005DE5917|nr:hypothetical protein [Yersinia vastinensis]CNI31828.1 phage protein (partial) [Yersinia frederiksenii]CNK24808.1 phage protein (partial) [Yersinia frederiksenii]
MGSGINKKFVFKIIIALMGCFVVFSIHQLGYELYMGNFKPQSRGVTLGFVMFYMIFVVIPAVFFSAFLKVKSSLIMIALVFVFMFVTWYGTNPLRVILMFLSGCMGYFFVMLSIAVENKIHKKKNS